MASEYEKLTTEQYEILEAETYEEVCSKTKFQIGAKAVVSGIRVFQNSGNRWTIIPVIELIPNQPSVKFSDHRQLSKIVKVFEQKQEKPLEHQPLKTAKSLTSVLRDHMRKLK